MAGTRIMITLPEKTISILEEKAKEKGITKSVLINLAIQEYLEKGEKSDEK